MREVFFGDKVLCWAAADIFTACDKLEIEFLRVDCALIVKAFVLDYFSVFGRERAGFYGHIVCIIYLVIRGVLFACLRIGRFSLAESVVKDK